MQKLHEDRGKERAGLRRIRVGPVVVGLFLASARAGSVSVASEEMSSSMQAVSAVSEQSSSRARETARTLSRMAAELRSKVLEFKLS